MKKVNTYIQGKNMLSKVNDYLIGKKTLIVIGSFNADEFALKVTESLTGEYEVIVYDQECSENNIKKLCEKMKSKEFDSIIGFGGGKVLDVVKAVAYFYPCFLMVIPSSASMDGACSALSVLYHEDHSFDRFLYLDKNPDVVLVDTQVIFDAPFSLLCAGMADAISSYYDVEYVCKKTKLEDEVMVCAKNCYENVYSLYKQVQSDYENRVLSDAVECIIKTNIYDSAVAFENAGCEFSHVLANATTKVQGSKGMHGERVGVGTLFMLLLENDLEEYVKLKDMLRALNMPTTLHDLNVKDYHDLIDSIMNEFTESNIQYDEVNIIKVLEKII